MWKAKKGTEEKGADSGGELAQPRAGAVGCRHGENPAAEAATGQLKSLRGF